MMSECIEWQKYRSKDGYGILSYKGKVVKAHRLAYCQANGLELKDIAGLVVRHKCDNPACINPEHLETGTQRDNNRDRAKRNRSAHLAGEKNGRAKLTKEQVDEIRRRYVWGSRDNNTVTLAREFGVCQAHVSEIVRNIVW
ncbi:TPA: HNH endonuclease [Escherichia coli]|nr:HNH endonuclease [Escherichia coli]HBH4416338.1 HNH endonuclease [Escherichia coli]HBH4518056.1 HNH endonuclease [Escherichia coli]